MVGGFQNLLKIVVISQLLASHQSVFTGEKRHTRLTIHNPLPMFGAYKRLTIKEDEGWANYRLPADILRPLAKEQNPKDWSRLNKSSDAAPHRFLVLI